MEANDEPQLQGGGRQNLDAEDAWIQLLSPFRRIVEDAVANTSFTLDISHNYPDRMNKANWTASFKSGEQQRAARPEIAAAAAPEAEAAAAPEAAAAAGDRGKRKRLRGRGAGGAGGRRSPPLPPKPKPPPQLETGGKRKRLRGRGLGSAGGP